MHRFIIALAGGMLWAALVCPAQGMANSPKPQIPDDRPWSHVNFQARGGIVLGGDVTFKENGYESSFDTDAGFGVALGIEFPSRGWVATGIEFDVDKVKYHRLGVEETLLGISVTARRTLKPGVVGPVLRPGLALGYGRMDAPYSSGTAGMFLIRGFLEFDVVSSNHIGLSCEFGMTGAPFGKISGQTGTFSAGIHPLIRVGVVLQ